MRTLNRKQKQLLDAWFNAERSKGRILQLAIDCASDDFPFDLYAELETINNFETLNQEINRYLYDKVAREAYKP